MKKMKYIKLSMDDIHPEARDIAVAWIENYQPHNSIMPEIAQKVKLASDIMKKCKRNCFDSAECLKFGCQNPNLD